MRKIVNVAATAAMVLGPAAFIAAPSASAAAACSSGIVSGNAVLGDRAYGSCTRFDRASQQARITADCIAGPDRNTSWFVDHNLHYTGYCGTYGLSSRARGSFVSFRY